MATIRKSGTQVLLVVDVQVGVVRGAWQPEAVVAKVADAVERARAAGVPVVWVQHGDAELKEDSDDWQLVPELARQPEEPLVTKSFNSAFEASTLDPVLAELGANHIILAGLASNWCIRATAYGALERGYDLTLVADAHTTPDQPVADHKTVLAADIVRELNVAMTWVSYPGRSSTATKVADLDFEAV